MTSTSNDNDLHAQVNSRLASHNHRYTSGRRQLIEALAIAGRPLTLPEIGANWPKLAQSSAYRNLDVLERCGVVRRIAIGGNYAHFELAEPLLDHHHHLICVGCGTIQDVHLTDKFERLVDENLAAAAKEAGFAPLHHSLDLHGHCADCTSPGEPT